MAAHLWAEMGCAFVEKTQDSFEKEELSLFLRGRYVSAALRMFLLPFLLDDSLGRITFCPGALVCPYRPMRDAFPPPQLRGSQVLWLALAGKRLYPAVCILDVSRDL